MITVIKVELIGEYLKKHNMSLSKFCELSRINISTIKRMRENRNFRLISLFKLAKALDMEVYEIVNEYPDKIID